MTSTARTIQVGDHDPEPEVSVFTGLTFSVDETLLGLNVLTAKVRQLKHSHETKNLPALKLDAEAVAKVAGQIKLLNDHLAGVCCRHINRRPR